MQNQHKELLETLKKCFCKIIITAYSRHLSTGMLRVALIAKEIITALPRNILAKHKCWPHLGKLPFWSALTPLSKLSNTEWAFIEKYFRHNN